VWSERTSRNLNAKPGGTQSNHWDIEG